MVLDDSLTAQADVYFEAGDHASLVHVSAGDFANPMSDARHFFVGYPSHVLPITRAVMSCIAIKLFPTSPSPPRKASGPVPPELYSRCS